MASAPTRMVIPSEAENASEVQRTILEQVERLGYPQRARFALRLALEEALNNAIQHGNAGDPTKQVRIEYTVEHDRTVITVCDDGPGFRPETLPDPTCEENLQRPGGRGVMLIKAYMTSVSFNKRGNCITFVKQRDCPLPRPEQMGG